MTAWTHDQARLARTCLVYPGMTRPTTLNGVQPSEVILQYIAQQEAKDLPTNEARLDPAPASPVQQGTNGSEVVSPLAARPVRAELVDDGRCVWRLSLGNGIPRCELPPGHHGSHRWRMVEWRSERVTHSDTVTRRDAIAVLSDIHDFLGQVGHYCNGQRLEMAEKFGRAAKNLALRWREDAYFIKHARQKLDAAKAVVRG